jgi:mono/diheme cytochrome c family protein
MDRAARWILSTVAVMALVLFAAAPAPAADLSQAVRTYAAYCANCHGKWGHGDGPSAVALKTKPRNLADPALQKMSDDALFRVIKEGGPAPGLSRDMHGWGDGLDDNQIRSLVAYIRTLPRN